MIYQILDYVDGDGRRVRVQTPMPTIDCGEAQPCFYGVVGVAIKTPMGVMPERLVVELPDATSVSEAFEQMADGTAERLAREQIEERHKRILVAGGVPQPGGHA